MTIGIVGEKQGMTRVFSEEGVSSPVTVVSAEPNTITQIKSLENDGYSSVQVTLGLKKEKHLTKSEIGHFKKAGIAAGKGFEAGFANMGMDPDSLIAKFEAVTKVKTEPIMIQKNICPIAS